MPTSTSANNGTISNEMAMKQSMQALGELAYALTELGVRATDPHEREGEPPGSMVLSTVKEMIEKLATLDQLKDSLQMDVPFEVLSTIDEKENPHKSVSHRRIEQAAVENQFASGKIEAIKSYQALLGAALSESFPALAPHLERGE